MSNFTEQPKDYCQYDYIEEDSDHELRGRDSSEDELDILLYGTPQQKRRLTRSLSRGSLEMSSSEDEFEKEMEKELDETMRRHEQQFTTAVESALSNQASCSTNDPLPNKQSDVHPSNAESHTADDFYNDIYFDSDDETQEGTNTSDANSSKKNKKSPGKQRMLTNDELLYDPDIDDKNQQWVNRQRECYYPSQSSHGVSSSQTSDSSPSAGGSVAETDGQIPKSDAVLNCPACMTTLCLDCQRHDLYTHQYRAMFVLNCTIVRTEQLTYAVPQKAGRKKWQKKQHKMQLERTDVEEGTSSSSGTSQQERFHPVRCSKCNTEVAVYDSDEVFHFFNVLTSLS